MLVRDRLTTVDAGTRVGRFMLQDTLGKVWKPMARPSWRPGVHLTSATVVGAWGYFQPVGAVRPVPDRRGPGPARPGWSAAGQIGVPVTTRLRRVVTGTLW